MDFLPQKVPHKLGASTKIYFFQAKPKKLIFFSVKIRKSKLFRWIFIQKNIKPKSDFPTGTACCPTGGVNSVQMPDSKQVVHKNKQKLYTKAAHKSYTKKLYTKVIHKSYTQKAVHKSCTQRHINCIQNQTKVVHKSCTQKLYTKVTHKSYTQKLYTKFV